MSSAWLLPEHIADVLPAQARHIEELRRSLLDVARGYGFELVIPPLLEHLESLLSGTGRELDLKTFKLVDQLSGRTLGVRADTTPQVARIDAHLLNRAGVTRLCYCGPVLHTRPAGLHATREPLQFGAEIYGHAGLEADLEIQDLALDCLRCAGVGRLALDLGDARIVRGVLAGVHVDAVRIGDLYAALAAKDGAALRELRARPAGRGAARAAGAAVAVRRRRGARGGAARAAGRIRRSARRSTTSQLARRAMPPRRTRRSTSASTWPTWAATPTTAARASRSTPRARAMRWRAAAATTRSARCSAATARRSASAST